MMRFRRKFEKALSEGQGTQLFFLAIIVLAVLAVLLLAGKLFSDLNWHEVLAVYLDPGVQWSPVKHDWFRIVIALLGVFLFSGLLVSFFINIIDNISGAYRRGDKRYRFKDHILIIGSGKSLLNMLAAIREHPGLSGKDILIMTVADVVPLRAQIWSALNDRKFCRHVTFYHCDRESLSHLVEAHADKASLIYLIGEDNEESHDALNLQCLASLRELCAGPGPVIQCFVTVESHSALNVLGYSKGDEASRLCVDVINESDYLVEQLLVHSDVLPAITSADAGKRTRIVIAGDSRIGRAFAGVAAQLCHYPYFAGASTRTQIVFIGRDMEKAMDNYVADHAGMFDLCHYHYVSPEGSRSFAPSEEMGDFMDLEWTFLDAEMSSPFVRSLLEKWAGDPKEELVVAVCHDDAAKSLSVALHLPRTVYDSGCRILVYQEDDPILVEEARKTGMYGQISAFGEGASEMDSLFLLRTTMGKRLNRVYDLEYGNPPAQDADSAWKALSQAHKLSSIASSNFMPMIIRVFGLEPTADAFASIPEEKMWVISEVEHRRWMTSVLMLGYFPAAKSLRRERDRFKYLKNERFIHLDIAPFDELTHNKEKDRLIVGRIPYVLFGEKE